MLLVAPLSGWTPYAVQLSSESLGPSVLLSPYRYNLLPELLRALTPLAEPEGFDYLGSSVPMKVSLLPQELTGELLPDPEKFAAPHQGLPKLSGQEAPRGVFNARWGSEASSSSASSAQKED